MEMKNLTAIAVLLILVVVTIGISASVSQEVEKDTSYTLNHISTAVETGFYFNFTGNTSTTHYIQLSTYNATGTISIRNSTTNTLIHADNYTFNTASGRIYNTTAWSGLLNDTVVNISYDYNVYDHGSKDAIANGTVAIGKMAKYTPLIALILAASLIISIVLSSLAGKRQ
jgi:hypothetical protein